MLAPSPPQAGFLYTIQPRLQPRVMLHEHVSSQPFKCGNRGSKAVPKTNRTIALADVVLARAAVTQSFESIANDGKRWNVEVVNDINISSEAFE